MRTSVYVDGFNLYYGAVRGTPFKWLDIRRMCELAFPKNEIGEIHYCTAIVKDAAWNPHQSTRQQMFIRALETTDVEVHYGSFLSSVVRMPLADPPVNGPRTVRVVKTEEKGSDVALGALLVAHGYQGRYEAAIVVSNDSDLVLPIRLVREGPRPAGRDLQPAPAVLGRALEGRVVQEADPEGRAARCAVPGTRCAMLAERSRSRGDGRSTRSDDAPAAGEARDLERRSVLPRLQLVGAEEAAARSGKAPVRDGVGAGQFVDGASRAAEPRGDILDQQIGATCPFSH